MSKKLRNKPSKYDNYLPKININPNLKEIRNYQPKIKCDAEIKLSKSDKLKLIKKLNFVDSRDLIGLNCIRIVSEIKTQYVGKAMGCYYSNPKTGDSEIWLSKDLFKMSRKIPAFLEQFIYADRILETLYHEIGHHKVTKSHSISKYKDEAFAEKYMLAYKKAWFKSYSSMKIGIAISKLITRIIIVIIKWSFYPFRNKYPMANLVYRYFNKEIKWEEFSTEAELLRNKKKKKSKVRKENYHPLHSPEY